jgi:citrate synthase
VELYEEITRRLYAGVDLDRAVAEELARWAGQHGSTIPGFGHRFHPVDPRTAPLLEQVDEAAASGVVSGRFARIGRAIEQQLAAGKGKLIPMNIDGATAVIYAELGFPAPLARGLFCLSRSVGILAHAWEQTQEGARIKGPLPRQWTPTYDGPPPRAVVVPDAED